MRDLGGILQTKITYGKRTRNFMALGHHLFRLASGLPAERFGIH